MGFKKYVDRAAQPAAAVAAHYLGRFARQQHRWPQCRAEFDKAGLFLIRRHYYEPMVLADDLRQPLDAPRRISGLDLNAGGQLALLAQFHYRAELEAIPLQPGPLQFGYHNGSFESGDAEFLYNMIRHFRPARMIEIGSGKSTLMAKLAISRNRQDDPGYACDHICIEPFEQPWLEQLGIRVIRDKVETCPLSLFETLGENDILFIDSSHVIRPQGDVVFEYLELLGSLKPGVLIHVHDIFTPRDYPAEWVLELRRMWDEQYLLEAFLAFNTSFQVIAAVNWLAHEHLDKLGEAAPVLAREPGREPGSFWMKRVA